MPHSVSAATEDFAQALGGHERIIHEYDLPSRSGAVVTVEVSWQPRYVEGVVPARSAWRAMSPSIETSPANSKKRSG